MTPDELLKGLRDIQLPDAAPAISSADFSLIPFGVLSIALLLVLLTRIIHDRSWLRQARRRLREINGDNPASAHALLELAGKIAAYRQVAPLPNAAFLPPHSIGPREVKLLYEHLKKVLAE